MQEIKNRLRDIIHELYNLDFDPELTPSPDNISADYSTNAPLKLAKEFHKPPMEIAKEIMARVTSSEGAPRESLSGGGEDGRTRASNITVSNPGFLNFTLSDEHLSTEIHHLATDFGAYISSDAYKDQTIICEFSDPNPFKVLHVGHLYTSIVGDAISRLYEYAGAKVIRANFGGDVGLHVAKTMYILQQKDPTQLTIEDIAKCYVEGTAAYEDSEQAKQEITKLNKEIYQINAAGEPKKVLSRSIFANGANTERPSPVTTGARERSEKESFSVLTELYWQGRELSYDYFKAFYASIGLKFDKFYPESTVAALGLKTVQEQLKKGVYEYSDGAVIFDGEKYGLHTRVFINQAGVPTYETKDVGLIFQKWDDYHFDKSIVITGSEQLEYMKVVLKSVEQYAPELVDRTTHLTHGLVKLPGNVKMSSRKGNFLKAVDVLDMVKTALKQEYDSEDETVSLAATKYAFLKYKMGGNIIFDPQESVKMTGNSGPYLLYACVRAKKILASVNSAPEEQTSAQGGFRSAAARELAPAARGDGPAGRDPGADVCSSYERNLAKKITEYRSILATAVSEMAPHKLANYLYELSQEFSRFYEHCPVQGSDRETERATLVQSYLSTMTHGLNILNINIPEEM